MKAISSQTDHSSRFRTGTWIAAAALMIYLVLLFVQCDHQASRWSTREVSCAINLKVLGISLGQYHEDHGCFPPPYLADELGKPMHSWRVLLLPYLGREELYEQYDFSKAWNASHNQELVSKLERTSSLSGRTVFRCPGDDSDSSPHVTNYVAVVGPNTMWPKDECVSINPRGSTAKDTIHLVEIRNSDILWTEPGDLDFRTMDFRINDSKDRAPSSHHLSTPVWFWQERVPIVNVSTVDGGVHRLPESTAPNDLHSLLTVHGSKQTNAHELSIQDRSHDSEMLRLRVFPVILLALVALTIGLAHRNWPIIIGGTSGSLLGLFMPEAGVHPACTHAEAYLRFFEHWTVKNAVLWGLVGGVFFSFVGLIFRCRGSRGKTGKNTSEVENGLSQ